MEVTKKSKKKQEKISSNISYKEATFSQTANRLKIKNVPTEAHLKNMRLVAEKVFLEDSRLQSLIHRLHIQEKRKGFTEKEILDKDLQLSVSMFCKQESELEGELKTLGSVTKVWQSYNFMGYVVQ